MSSKNNHQSLTELMKIINREVEKYDFLSAEQENNICEAIVSFVERSQLLARIDENIIAQTCFDGITASPGDTFTKLFAKLLDRGKELEAQNESK